MTNNLLTPNSNQYLTTRLQSNNFRNNLVNVEIGSLFEVLPSQSFTAPQVFTHGDYVCYVKGAVRATGAFSAGEVVGSLPSSFGRLWDNNTNYEVAIPAFLGGALTVSNLFLRQNSTLNKIEFVYSGTTAGVATNILHLNGIVFYREMD